MSVTSLIESVKIPLTIKKAFVRAPHPSSPEENLWRNVAARAVLDAYGLTMVKTSLERARVQDSAHWWFKTAYAEAVFDAGGIEFARVCKQVVDDRKGD